MLKMNFTLSILSPQPLVQSNCRKVYDLPSTKHQRQGIYGGKNNQAKASEIRVWVWRVLAHGKTLAADSKPSEEGENTAGGGFPVSQG